MNWHATPLGVSPTQSLATYGSRTPPALPVHFVAWLTEGNVRSIAIQRVGELRARDREALERLLGRPLQQNEEVSIRSYPHDLLPEDAARRRAAGDLAQKLADGLRESLRLFVKDEVTGSVNANKP